MAIKTQATDESVADYIEAIKDEQKKKDCKELLRLIKKVTRLKPQVWNNGTVGFGTFHYKSQRSKQEGEWYYTGFAARKANITIYVFSTQQPDLLKKLGKCKTGGGCLYINKLADIDTKVLEKMILNSIAYSKTIFA
jgi:hypothetical protein